MSDNRNLTLKFERSRAERIEAGKAEYTKQAYHVCPTADMLRAAGPARVIPFGMTMKKAVRLHF